jgi:hypothetical protein
VVGYDKLEQAADEQDLVALRATLCPLEREAMLEAVGHLVGFYLRTAPPLATQQGIAYPADLAPTRRGDVVEVRRWQARELYLEAISPMEP